MVKILKSFAASVFLWANRPNSHEHDNEPPSIRYAVDMWRPPKYHYVFRKKVVTFYISVLENEPDDVWIVKHTLHWKSWLFLFFNRVGNNLFK